MRCLAVCVLADYLVVQLCGLTWWAPRLTVVGLVFAIARSPGRWMTYAAVAAGAVVLLTAHDAMWVVAGYLVAAWLIERIASRWDLHDWRIQCLAVGAATLVTTILPSLRASCWSVPMVGWLIVHTALTAASVPGMQRLTARLAR